MPGQGTGCDSLCPACHLRLCMIELPGSCANARTGKGNHDEQKKNYEAKQRLVDKAERDL